MSTVLPKVYRFSNLGSSLDTTLANMVKEGKITDSQKEAIMKQFDKSMSQELAKRRHELPNAKLRAEVSFYQRLYDTWSFSLLNSYMDIDGRETMVSDNAKFFSTLAPKQCSVF